VSEHERRLTRRVGWGEQLWVTRIGAAVQEHGLNYNRFIHGLVQVRRTRCMSCSSPCGATVSWHDDAE
jgi:ribosomal protein L20